MKYVFEVGKTYMMESLDAGMVCYKCVKRTQNEAFFVESDMFSAMDNVERDAKCYKITADENGDEFVDLYYSKRYDIHFRIYANTPNGFNNLRENQ